MNKGTFWVIMAGVALLPVWRCGLREKLTFYEFVINHTVFGPPVQYLPEELLTRGESEGIYMEMR